LKLSLGEHGTIVGTTGSGKTEWAKSLLLPSTGRGIIIDTEDGYDFSPSRFRTVSLETSVRLGRSSRPFMVRVDMDRFDPRAEDYFTQLLNVHDTVIYVDEANDFSDGHEHVSAYLNLLRKSRKRRVSVWSSTQRPALVHKTIFTQSVHKVYFAVDSYDSESWLRRYAPHIYDMLPSIPYGSYRWIYSGPDSVPHIYAPITPHRWPVHKDIIGGVRW
jgi:DNA helicase HerA-like ATPase